MASTDARPVPQKNVAYRVTFPILDADGDLVTGATSPDSEISKDGGTFTDCTNEATEIATSSGMYFLDLTSTEMNADTVAIIVKSGNGKTTPIVLYPEEAGDIRVNVTAYGGTAGTFSGGRPEVNTTHAAGTAWGSGAITAASIATGAIDADALAADAGTEIGTAVWATTTRVLTANTNLNDLSAAGVRAAVGLASANLDTQLDALPTAAENADAVWDEDATGHQTGGTFGQAIGDPGADTNTIFKAVVTDATGATVGVDVAAVLADTGTDGVVVAAASKTGYALSAAGLADFFDTDSGTTYASAVAGSVVKEIADNAGGSALTEAGIADAVWDEARAGHVAAGSFGEGVASVTGAVGSVTGNVGGNVAGSVGSVTAAVTVGTNNDKTGYRLSSTALDDILRTALTEAYANLGAAPTLSELLFEVRALLAEKAVSSTTLTTKKLDGSTTAATYTLDSDTAPTSITRAS
jgi:hypothetical protein